MINIVCVNSNNYLGSGQRYVEILHDMVIRNLPEDIKFKFICFTDDKNDYANGIEKRELPENLDGWYNKIALFKSGIFAPEDLNIFFDLDTVITGPLDDILKYDGSFAILRDFYRPSGLQSSVMVWRGDHSYIWNKYADKNYPKFSGGDQEWMENVLEKPDIIQQIYPKMFASYKVHAQHRIPDKCSVVVFHGLPRPHEAMGWVEHFWKINGATSLNFKNQANTEQDKLIENIDYAHSLGRKFIELQTEHDGHAVIVGGAPSIDSYVDELKMRKERGQKIFALNNSWKWLRSHGIEPDYHVMLDARPENAEFIPVPSIPAYYASQCDKSVLDAVPEAVLWDHVNASNIVEHSLFVCGGSTVGLCALSIAYILGYRKLHVYGMDSSYTDNKHHAYSQTLNDNENVIEVSVGERKFKTAPWMAEQAAQFCSLSSDLLDFGATLTIHGDGLLSCMAQNYKTASHERAESVLENIRHIKNPVGVEVGVFKADLSTKLLARNDLKLYMVDSWRCHDGEYKETDFHGRLTQEEQDGFYDIAQKRVSVFGDRAVIMKMDSIEAAKQFDDESLDFVFLDADHNYNGVKADIEAWMPKVKRGGILCGHDYDHPEFPEWGVKRAVDEIGHDVRLGLNFTWFIEIPSGEGGKSGLGCSFHPPFISTPELRSI